ncbi:hypothetical protein ACJJTC_007512 [Scirpophaga incertulas]
MNSMCRLCLTVAPEKLQELSERADYFRQMLASLRVQISLVDDTLPKKICLCCIEKINEIYKFHVKIVANQDLLLQYKSQTNDEIKKEMFHCINDKQPQVLTYKNVKENDVKNTIDLKIEDEIFYDDASMVTEDESLFDAKAKDIDCITDTVTLTNSNNILSITKLKCLTCFEVCNSKALLLQHYNTIHTIKSNPENVHNFKILKSSHKSTIYQCNICCKEYDSKKSVIRHLLLGHTTERPFVCKLCGRTYKTASEIIRHSRAHDGTRFFCKEQCGYSTVYLGALREHERRHNKGEAKYKCEECGKGFQVKTWYDQHQNVHTGLKPFVCDICGVSFHMDRYLTTHRSSVHPQSSQLKRYVCVHCSLPCDSRKALTQHLKVHGMSTSFLCDLCGKTLSNRQQLKFHKQVHLGVKPFSCSTCDKAFTKKFNLQLHERSHTGLKQHACLLCGKHYSQRSTLLRHHTR